MCCYLYQCFRSMFNSVKLISNVEGFFVVVLGRGVVVVFLWLVLSLYI